MVKIVHKTGEILYKQKKSFELNLVASHSQLLWGTLSCYGCESKTNHHFIFF